MYKKIFLFNKQKRDFLQACKIRNCSSSLIRIREGRKSGNICHR